MIALPSVHLVEASHVFEASVGRPNDGAVSSPDNECVVKTMLFQYFPTRCPNVAGHVPAVLRPIAQGVQRHPRLHQEGHREKRDRSDRSFIPGLPLFRWAMQMAVGLDKEEMIEQLACTLRPTAAFEHDIAVDPCNFRATIRQRL